VLTMQNGRQHRFQSLFVPGRDYGTGIIAPTW
jgi:hypothetical protein